jgi:S-adenosyl methyltransferase
MADFDPRTPSIARVYDYILGGKDNFAADREVADRLMAAAPLTVEVSRENRQFLARAVTWAAGQGIGQFIDLGCGMPTVPNTHETAQAIIPAARVAYIDNDPVVLTHLRALAEHGNPGVTVVHGDVREPDAIIGAIQDDIDLEAPACLLMGYLLHFFAPGTWWPVTSHDWRPGATWCFPSAAPTVKRRNRVSAPTPRAGRGSTTIQCRTSRASSAP